MRNEAGKKLASVVFGSTVHQELKNLCSNHFDSILREKSPTAMEYFSWNSIWLELEAKAPMLTTSLKKSMKSFSEKNKRIPVVCISMLLKCQNKNMCMVQAIVSLILYTGHAGKWVSLIR